MSIKISKLFVKSFKKWNMMLYNFAVLILCLMLHSVSCDSYDDLCKSILPVDYKLYESPNRDGPVNVYNRFEVLNIGEINEEKMDYLLHVFYTSIWKDKRLKPNLVKSGKMDHKLLTKECLPYLWKPDIFFETAKKVEIFKSSAPSISLRIYYDSTVSLTIRYLFRSSCNMDFYNYPFDSQVCEFYVSLISPDSEAVLGWLKESDDPYWNTIPAVTVLRPIEPLQYFLGDIRVRKFVDMLPDANYTTLIAVFIFDRRLIGSIINTYIPSTLIVFMSWIGFWLGVEAVPARVALSITSLLTLCTQIQQYKSQLPPVNYIKAMDIWLFVCIFLVFSTLLEFAVAYNIDQKRKSVALARNSQDMKDVSRFDNSNVSRKSCSRSRLFKRSHRFTSEQNLPSKLKSNFWTICEKISTKFLNQKVDEFSQKFYPLFFLIFGIIYWSYYLNIYFHPPH